MALATSSATERIDWLHESRSTRLTTTAGSAVRVSLAPAAEAIVQSGGDIGRGHLRYDIVAGSATTLDPQCNGSQRKARRTDKREIDAPSGIGEVVASE